MAASYGACKVVGKGGVGESGATSLIHHNVTGANEIMMVVRVGDNSLCGNTGAAAILLVNGSVVAHGNLPQDPIQGTAKPGDHVILIVHTYPLFNDIACVRLGEMEFTLEQCDLVK